MGLLTALVALCAWVAVDPPPSHALESKIEAIQSAVRMVDEDPYAGAQPLLETLQFPSTMQESLAHDPLAQAVRLDAQLTLSRALLATGRRSAAERVMDEVLRTWRQDPIESERYGPSLERFYQERKRQFLTLRQDPLEIICSYACRVFINEREVSPHPSSLQQGSYRIRIEARSPHEQASLAPIHLDLTIRDGETIAPIHFPLFLVASPLNPAVDPEKDPLLPPKKSSPRAVPTWIKISMLAGGAVTAGTGIALLSIHGTCSNGGSVSGSSPCPSLFQTKPAGAVLLGLGAAMAISGVLLFILDGASSHPHRKILSLQHGRIFF